MTAEGVIRAVTDGWLLACCRGSFSSFYPEPGHNASLVYYKMNEHSYGAIPMLQIFGEIENFLDWCKCVIWLFCLSTTFVGNLR